MELTIHILIFLFGGYWVQQGIFVYKFWIKGLPGSGFMPVLFGVLLMVLSGFLLIQDLRRKIEKSDSTNSSGDEDEISSKPDEKYPEWIRPLIPAVYTLLAIGLMVVAGMVPAMFLTAFIWLFLIGKIKLGKSLLISIIITLVVYLVFVLWLRIPFPRGVFGI
ncbi:MAG TPA: tripartite tricarboxylate transporter TctB family protein [Sphaerochaeta sp.]|nr:tripartite tricarboxylate transporter TctB family protein [Sphaerochaeta sp.]